MPAGLKYNLNPIEGKMPEFCRVETIYRLSGGFNLDLTNLAAGALVPPMNPLFVDFATRKAYAIKGVIAYEGAESGATSIKVKKGSLIAVGDRLLLGEGSFTVSAVDKSNDAYDALTVSAIPAAIASGAGLKEGKLVKKTAKVYANAASAATSVKVAKGSGIVSGDVLTDGTNDITVSAINTTGNFDYDTLTVAALTAGLSAGDEIVEKTASQPAPAHVANFLNYAWCKAEEGATVTAVGQAFEIRESKLITPISDEDKKSLGDRFMFTL